MSRKMNYQDNIPFESRKRYKKIFWKHFTNWRKHCSTILMNALCFPPLFFTDIYDLKTLDFTETFLYCSFGKDFFNHNYLYEIDYTKCPLALAAWAIIYHK